MGNSEKDLKKDDVGYYLTPRSSFQRVKLKLKGYSKKWSKEDLYIAKEIGDTILNKKYNETINQKNNDLTNILNHSNALIYIRVSAKLKVPISIEFPRNFHTIPAA